MRGVFALGRDESERRHREISELFISTVSGVETDMPRGFHLRIEFAFGVNNLRDN